MVRNKRSRVSHSIILGNKAPFEFTESYNSLRTNLDFMSTDKKLKKIIITSSVPGEGKSSVSINIALSLASSGKRVILLDCDMRKPVIQKYLRIKNLKGMGITNILAGDGKPDQSIVVLSDSGLNVIVSGPIPPNPAEILGSNKMHRLITLLEPEYDYMIFDTPPVMAVTDATALSKWCDGIILVIGHKSTPIETVMQAKKALENVNANVIGCVLNKFKADKHHHAYYKYKYYGEEDK